MNGVRENEVKRVRISLWLRALNQAILFSSTALVAFAAIVTYSLVGNELNVGTRIAMLW